MKDYEKQQLFLNMILKKVLNNKLMKKANAMT